MVKEVILSIEDKVKAKFNIGLPIEVQNEVGVITEISIIRYYTVKYPNGLKFLLREEDLQKQ